jgi:hypothetical protein
VKIGTLIRTTLAVYGLYTLGLLREYIARRQFSKHAASCRRYRKGE